MKQSMVQNHALTLFYTHQVWIVNAIAETPLLQIICRYSQYTNTPSTFRG